MDKQKQAYIVDGIGPFDGGVNSGILPQLLSANQLAFATNATVRGGFVTNRPGFKKQVLSFGGDPILETSFKKSLFQGATYFKPDIGASALVSSQGGRLFQAVPDNSGNIQITDVSIPGDPNPPAIDQAWLWQSERWVIVNDGVSIPIFYDGLTTRRSVVAGSQVTLQNVNDTHVGTIIPVGTPVNIPAGTSLRDFAFISPGFTFGAPVPNGNAVTIPNVHQTASLPATLAPISIRGDHYLFVGISGTNMALIVNQVGGIPAGTTYSFPNYIVSEIVNHPVQQIGTLISPFTIPAIGGSAVALISQSYSSGIGTIVHIGSEGDFRVTASANIAQGELPVGRMGAYGLGRNWVCLPDGKTFVASDIVGSSSGTAPFNFRDAVLKMTDNTRIAGGGNFAIPSNSGLITAMVFVATLDASLGQGPLLIFSETAIASNQAPLIADSTQWNNLGTTNNVILTQVLLGSGTTGQYAVSLANGDIIFRSSDGQVRSLALSRMDFDKWPNVPISREMARVVDADTNISLMNHCSTVTFDNRELTSCLMNTGPFGTFGQGLMALNFDPISNLRGKAPSVWDGLWTGINTLQMVTGTFGSVLRTFAYAFNVSTQEIEIWEILTSGSDANNFDNDSLPIIWSFETSSLFRNSKGKGLFEPVELVDGEIYLSDIQGQVHIESWYRAENDPCWHPWFDFSVCGTPKVPKQYRTRLGLGEPDVAPCDPTNNRPYRIGTNFQFRFQISGTCKFIGGLFKAQLVSQPQMARPICDPLCDTLNEVTVACEPCKDIGPCLNFPLVFYNLDNGKLYSNALMTFFITCPDNTVKEVSVQPGTIVFTLPFPPDFTGPTFPPLVLPCQAGGNIVRQIPDGASQSDIDAIVNSMIAICAQAIANATVDCSVPPLFFNEQVFFVHDCPPGQHLDFNDSPPV